MLGGIIPPCKHRFLLFLFFFYAPLRIPISAPVPLNHSGGETPFVASISPYCFHDRKSPQSLALKNNLNRTSNHNIRKLQPAADRDS
ncbi:hypothetical protein C8R47DRAFT_1145648 [Mycena vitilis]|nr:hypothetical protein C8R47DRAFT_1145648 [Mycena vitilis]